MVNQRLLIITQKIDRDDPVLGFFHRWVDEFAKHCESVTVICLQQGKYCLPNNVKVLSLGKEGGASRVKYLFRFYKYIWRERKNYNNVFVHMNQEYVLLGGIFWKFWNKKVWLWRNHPRGSLLTKLAVLISDRVFCTSVHSFTARFPKTEIMPAGIDTNFFKRDETTQKIPNSLLFLGRISPIKHPEIFIEALGLLKKDNVNFIATIVGDPLVKDEGFYDRLKRRAGELDLNKELKFLSAVSNDQTVKLYNQHQVYVNLTPTGSFDKTILEAMASGMVVVVANQSFNEIKSIDSSLICRENDPESLAISLKHLLSLGEDRQEEIGKVLIGHAKDSHSLANLIEKLLIS